MNRRWVVAISVLAVLITASVRAQTQPGVALPGYSQTAIDVSSDNLGQYYGGFDPEAVYRTLESLVKAGTKSDFETTAQYEARKVDFAKQELLPGVSVESRLGFVLNNTGALFGHLHNSVSMTYDADSQTAKITISFEPLTSLDILRLQTAWRPLARMVLKRALSGRGHYIGQNAFGAVADVSRVYSEEYGVALDPGTWLTPITRGQDSSTGISLSVHMQPEEARVSWDHVRVLLLCTPKEPWLYEDLESSPPTLEAPAEYHRSARYIRVVPNGLMVFDETSGKVFAPISQSSLEQDRAKEAERLQRERELREQLYPVRVTVEGLNSTAITYRIDDGPEISGKGSLGTPGLKVFALPLTIEAKSRITISTKYVYEVQGLRFVLNGRSVVPEWRTEKGKKFRVQAERWAGDSRGIPTFRTATTTFERP